MSAAAERLLMTAEEFWNFSAPTDAVVELVDGEVVEMAPPGPIHSRTDGRLQRRLGSFVEQHGLGEVFPNSGFILRRNPDVVRAPDHAFVRAERIAEDPPPSVGWWELVPDLVVEVVSPNDGAQQIADKVQDYLTAGVRLVWVVYPLKKCVHVYSPDAPVRFLVGDAELDGEDVVPGFRLPLAQLWE